jgi:alpha-beta hydrolase superfamily lysophospholipase
MYRHFVRREMSKPIAKLHALKPRRIGLRLAVVALSCALGAAPARAQMPAPVNSLADAERLSESIADQHGILTSEDKTCLFYRYWPAGGGVPADRAVIVLHGIGYQSGPYKVISDALNPQGMDVYALDARAHGLSCGRRGYIGTPAQVAADVSAIVQFVHNERHDAKIYLLGESMGGAYALNYLRKNSGELRGLILLAPALGLNNRQVFQIRNVGLLPYFLFAHRAVKISLTGWRLEESSRDTQFIAERRTDPLAYKKISFGYLWDIKRLVKNWESEIAPNLDLPTLIVQGGKDVIVSRKDCKLLAQIKATQGIDDRQYKLFPRTRHTTLWDPDTPEILKFVTQWIIEH